MTNSVLTPEQSPSSDAEIWQAYQELGEFNEAEEIVYDDLLPPQEIVEAQFQQFIDSGFHDDPDLRPRLTPEDRSELAKGKERLSALKSSIPIGESLPLSKQERAIRQAYHWRLNESIANVRMLEAAANDAGETGREKALDRKRFERYNTFIYGEPDKDIFAAVADWYSHEAEQVGPDAPEELRTAAATVLEALGDSRGTVEAGNDRNLLIPDVEVFDAVREGRNRKAGFIALLMAGVKLPESKDAFITEAVGDPALEQMLLNMGSTQKLQDASYWANTPASIKRPAKYNMRVSAFQEVSFHEIVHALERINGQKSGLMLASAGLDRYETGNEGRSVAAEEIVHETFMDFAKQPRWQQILCRDLAVSLAHGTDGSPKRFGETYKVINAVYKMYELQHPEVVEEMTEPGDWAASKTKDLLIQVYKGTDGKGGGSVNLRPMIYLQGNVAFWKKAKQDIRSSENGANEVWIGDMGKFDPTNSRHIAVLQKAGVLPTHAAHESGRE